MKWHDGLCKVMSSTSINVSNYRLKWRPMPDKNAGIYATP